MFRRRPSMATAVQNKQPQRKRHPVVSRTIVATKRHAAPVARVRIPSGLRKRAEALLQESYDYMDSPVFRHRGIEKELFDFAVEPQLPMTSWYQPTREDMLDGHVTGQPQLMKAPEERLMFLRFNYCKKRLTALQKRI